MQGISSYRGVYIPKFGKMFSFGISAFGQLPTPNFTPICSTCRPREAKKTAHGYRQA